MNILVIHEAEYIEKVIFEYQVIPEIWASKGHRVYVIDYPATWKKKSWHDFGSLRTQYLADTRCAGKKKGVTLIRLGIIKVPGLSRLSAFIAYFFLIPRVIKKYQIEKIFLYSVPTNGLQTVFWAKRLKIPIHFRLLDVLHRLVPSRVLIWPTYLMERLVYPRVNELTAITPKLTEYAIRLGANPKTTTYLPTASDIDNFYPTKKADNLLKNYGLTGKDTVILFAGTLYHFSGLDHLLLYLAKNKPAYSHLKFMIVGRGEQAAELQEIVWKYQLDNVILTGFINYAELPKYVNLADICINPFEINKITNIIFPSKIYQYLACEKPVIATRLTGLIDLFPDNRGKNNLFYFDTKKPAEFFLLAGKVKGKRIKDANPSLQAIANKIEKALEILKVKQ